MSMHRRYSCDARSADDHPMAFSRCAREVRARADGLAGHSAINFLPPTNKHHSWLPSPPQSGFRLRWIGHPSSRAVFGLTLLASTAGYRRGVEFRCLNGRTDALMDPRHLTPHPVTDKIHCEVGGSRFRRWSIRTSEETAASHLDEDD